LISSGSERAADRCLFNAYKADGNYILTRWVLTGELGLPQAAIFVVSASYQLRHFVQSEKNGKARKTGGEIEPLIRRYFDFRDVPRLTDNMSR
jgi:hypothetical protein